MSQVIAVHKISATTAAVKTSSQSNNSAISARYSINTIPLLLTA